MSKTISFKLNPQSIDKAIAEVKEYKAWVNRKAGELARRLATIGAMTASIRFTGAYYQDGNKDVSIEVEPTDKGWKIVASGEDVCFIEFGAGVYYNGSEPYPEPRPPGVAGIGEYGQGKGKQDSWGYYDDNGELVITHGTPAAMPMYHASQEMERQFLRIAREVFG